MTKLIDGIREGTNKVLTENGDTAYASTFNKNLDFFGIAAALRNKQDDLMWLFYDAYNEEPKLAIKNLLYLRDVRGGLGERNSTRNCIRYLITHGHKMTAVSLIPYLVEYGRYDDILLYLDYPSTEKAVAEYISRQLEKDIEDFEDGKPISLLSKWLPSINASSKETVTHANKLCKLLGLSKAEYRKTLSKLRKGKIVERNLTERDYTFEYSKLPSRALAKYVKAFNRNDQERYQAYKESLKKGEVKAKVSNLFPYEVVRMLRTDKALAEELWKAYDRNELSGNTIVVRDGSGSMTWGPGSVMPMEVADSLSILFAEQLTGDFHNKFITFSNKPKFVELKGDTLEEKVWSLKKHNEIANTNIEKVYDLLYQASLSIDDPSEYIQRVIIISDMEFDEGATNVPTYERMKQKFESAGIPLPTMIYWNVNARNVHFAAKPESNIRLVSGMSQNIITNIITNTACDPVSFMLQTLEKYDRVVNKILDNVYSKLIC